MLISWQLTRLNGIKLPDDQNICRYCLRNDIENERHVIFDCDNYNTLQQDTLKKVKAIDNIGINTAVSLKNLKFSYRMDL